MDVFTGGSIIMDYELVLWLVHPKMKVMSLITHPHVVPNPLDLRSSSELRKNILIASYNYGCTPDVTWIILPISLLCFRTVVVYGGSESYQILIWFPKINGGLMSLE